MTLGATQKGIDAISDPTLSDTSALEPSRRRGWTILATTLLLLLAIVGAVLLIIDNWRSGNEIIEAQKVQVVTFRVLALMQNAETGQRGYLLTGKKSYLEPFNRSMSRIEPALDDLVALSKENAEFADEATTLYRLSQEKIAELHATIAAFDRGGPGAALPLITTDQGQLTMDQIRAIAREVLQRQSVTLSDRTLRWQQNSDLLILVSGVAIVLTILASALIIRNQRHHAAMIEAARRRLATANLGLEAHVALRTADLKEANEEIQRYAHIASHDLRAPLVNIMGYSGEMELVRQEVLDLMAKEGTMSSHSRRELKRLNADFEEALSFIRLSIDKMNRLINAILTLARSGQREFRYEELDMEAILSSIKATLQHRLTTNDIHFKIGSMPALKSDRMAIEQIFSNLAENAVKYLDARRPGQITITARTDSGGVTFVIADNGRGIAQRDLSRIFDPFRRAGFQDQPGEGIGLAHVRTLVRRLGGRITCESDIGAGSRFMVRLPVANEKQRG